MRMKDSRNDQSQETKRGYALPFEITGVVLEAIFNKFSNGMEEPTKLAAH
jgi:hypothetical protein